MIEEGESDEVELIVMEDRDGGVGRKACAQGVFLGGLDEFGGGIEAVGVLDEGSVFGGGLDGTEELDDGEGGLLGLLERGREGLGILGNDDDGGEVAFEGGEEGLRLGACRGSFHFDDDLLERGFEAGGLGPDIDFDGVTGEDEQDGLGGGGQGRACGRARGGGGGARCVTARQCEGEEEGQEQEQEQGNEAGLERAVTG